MYSLEQRTLAVETLIKFDHSYADTIAELGYPNRHSLHNWWRDYQECGEVRPGKPTREPKFTLEMKRVAAGRCLEHGRGPARTMRALGYPKSREYLASWIGGLAPGLRRGRPAIGPRREKISLEEKIQAVAELEGRYGTAAEVAARHGVAREMPYVWRRQLLLGDDSDEDEPVKGRSSVSERFDMLPANEAELTQMALELRAEIRRLQIEPDVRSATLEIAKKTWAPTRTG